MLSGTTGGLGSFGELTLGFHGIGRDTVTSQLPDQKWTLRLHQPMRVGFTLASNQTDVDLRLFHGKTPRVTSTTPGIATESFARTLRPGTYTLLVSKHAAADGNYELHVDTSVVASPTRVEAEALGGTAVRVNWLDNSNNENGFAVQQWRKHTWHKVARTPAGATAAIVHDQPVGADMTFRARAMSVSGSAVSPDRIVTQTAEEDTSGYFKITDFSGINIGEATWTPLENTIAVQPQYQNHWVYASNWQDAVYTAVAGTVRIQKSDGSFVTPDPTSFPSGGDFIADYEGILHDDLPNQPGTGAPEQKDENELADDDVKVVAFEDSYGAIDRDYDDFYYTVEVDKLDFTSLTVSGSGRTSTDSGFGAPILYVDGDGNGNASISLSADFSPTDRGTDILWKLVKNGNGSTPDHGDFSSQPVTVQLAADSYQPWTVEAGVDQDGDDLLGDDEVVRQVEVRLSSSVSISVPDNSAAETDSAHPPDPGQYKITRTKALPYPVTVNYTMSGSAIEGTDYYTLSGSTIIPADATSSTINLDPINDALVEDDEQATLTMDVSNDGAYHISGTEIGTVTIHDNEPTVTIEASAYAAEPTLAGRFTVERYGDVDHALTVGYSVGGTAITGSDYQSLSGSVTIAGGDSTADIYVTPIDDSNVEPPETVVAMLGGSTSTYHTGSPSTATVILQDNDGQTVLNSLTATDTRDASRTATNPGQTKLFIPEPDTGDASITLSDVYSSTEQDPQQHILWQVSGAGASPTYGNFESNPTITLSLASGNRMFLLQAGVDTDHNGSLSIGEISHEIDVYVVKVDLTAYRTGGNLGLAVTESDENSEDPNKYLILTNNDFEEGTGQTDDDNTTAIIPTGAEGDDDDLARITIQQLPTYFNAGTVALVPSDPTSARIFNDQGQQMTNLTIDLEKLRQGDVDVWLEGLKKDSDFTLRVVFKDPSGVEIANDDVHMLIANWTWQDSNGQPLEFLTSTNKELLLRSGVRGESDTPVPDESKFKLSIDGLPSNLVSHLTVNSTNDGGTDSFEDSFAASSNATMSTNFAVPYWSEDGAHISVSDAATILGALGVNIIADGTVKGRIQTANDDQSQVQQAAPLLVQYVSGTDDTDARQEQLEAMKDIYFMKGYMLVLTAPGVPNDAPFTWSITKGGNPVGHFYPSEKWTDYESPLARIPTDRTVYWRSDTGGQDAETYDLSVTFKDANTGKNTTVKWKLKTRLLDPAVPKLANFFNDDADMAQRAMIQDFYLDKGRLQSYRPGQYDDKMNGFYVASNFGGANFSPVADEVWNFDKFTLGTAAPSEKLNLRVVQGIWDQFKLISTAPLPTGVSTADPQYQTWLNNAVQGLALAPGGLMDKNGQRLFDQDVLKAFVQHESGGRHSYDLATPLAFSSVNVGEPKSSDGHYYTDDGIGFAQVQPYNAGNFNLYKPADNLTRAAQIVAGNVNSASNPAVNKTAPEKVWWAYYKYNSGHFSTKTIQQLRDAHDQSALRADDACNKLGLNQVNST